MGAPGSSLWVDHRKTKKLLEGIKVAIPVQQRVLFSDAESGDQTIDRFPNGVTAAPQEAIVPRGVSRKGDAA